MSLKLGPFYILVVWICIGYSNVFAQPIPARIFVSEASFTSGSLVEVEVTLDLSRSSIRLGAYAAKLTWDSNVLSLIEIRDGDTPAFGEAQTREDVGELIFSQFSADGADGVISLLKIQFQVIGEAGASSEIALLFTELTATETFTDVLEQVEVQNATVTVFERITGTIVGRLNLSTDMPVERDTLNVEVVIDLSELSSGQLGTYAAKLTWDNNVLSLIDARDGDTPAFGGAQTRENVGGLVFSQFSVQGAAGVISLLNVRFLVVGQAGGESSLEVTFDELTAAVSFVDLLPHIQVQETSFSVAEGIGILPQGPSGPIALDLDLTTGDQGLRKTRVRPRVGDEVVVDIAAVSGAQSVVGFQVVLGYDPEQLEWMRFQVKDLFASAAVLPANLENGTATISAAILGGETSGDTGSIGEVRFRVLSGFSGETRVRSVAASYDSALSIGSGGAFVVVGGDTLAPSPDFDGNGVVDFPDFLRFARGFGKSKDDVAFDAVLDLDQSGDIGFPDFIQFAQSFGL